MDILHGTITDIKEDKVKILFKTMGSIVSGFIKIPKLTADIKIGDKIYEDCEVSPKYEIQDKVVVLISNENLSDGIILAKE